MMAESSCRPFAFGPNPPIVTPDPMPPAPGRRRLPAVLVATLGQGRNAETPPPGSIPESGGDSGDGGPISLVTNPLAPG
jgi:hypothetical protein